jgi:hypothetical protein
MAEWFLVTELRSKDIASGTSGAREGKAQYNGPEKWSQIMVLLPFLQAPMIVVEGILMALRAGELLFSYTAVGKLLVRAWKDGRRQLLNANCRCFSNK